MKRKPYEKRKLYTYLEIPRKFLPRDYRDITEWQTYEISRGLGTVKIEDDGRMFYASFPDIYSGFSRLNCNGNIEIGTFGKNPNNWRYKSIILEMKCKNGILQKIDFKELR